MKRKLALILAALLVFTYTSCGSEGKEETTTDSQADNLSETTAAEDEYVFPELDMNDEDFVIISRDNSEMYNKIEIETQTGDLLDDATWKRNVFIEDKFNVNIVQISDVDVKEAVRLAVTSGDDLYQAAFPLTNTLGSDILDGIYLDLSKGSGFNFDEQWWDQSVMSDAYIGKDKAIYFANSDLSLLNFEATWCMYFNRRMIEDNQLDMPYQLVRDGKWTFDELYKYISAGANLNGDDSWGWNQDGNCVYGFTSMGDFVTQAYVCSDEKQIKFVDGEPKLMAGSAKFYDVSDKLAKIFGEEGTAFFSNDRTNNSHYESVFSTSRAMFCGCEIKGGNGAGKFSNMTDDYGIVPMPKYEENQDYVSPIAVWTYFLTVPASNPDLESASIILDAMSYLSYRDIVPIYYDVVLQVKHIRDEDTTEMLDIIRDTRTYFTAYAFGFGNGLRNELVNSVIKGTGNAASIVATYKTQTEEQMASAMETFNSK